MQGTKRRWRLRAAVLRRDKFTCQRCGKRLPAQQLEADHAVPLAKGGTDSVSNLQTLCVPCHRQATNGLIAQLAVERRTAGRKPVEVHPGLIGDN